MARKRTATQTAELRELSQLSDVEISDLAAQYHVDVANPDTGKAYTRAELIEMIASQKKQAERQGDSE